MKLYDSLERLQNLPLDKSCIFEAYDALEAYIAKERSTAYPGQIVAVIGEFKEKGIYVILRNDAEPGKLMLNKLADDLTVKGFDEAIKKLQADVDLIKSDYATQTDLDKLKESILGIGDLDDTLDTIKEIQDWINQHKEDFDNLASLGSELNKKISDVDTKFTDKTNKIDEEISGIKKDLKENYATKEDLKNFTGVERVISFEFGDNFENSSEIIKVGTTVTEIKIDVCSPAKIETPFELLLEESESKEIWFKITDDDFSLADQLETGHQLNVSLQNSYIFSMSRHPDRDWLVKFTNSNFNECSGKVYIKYY